MQAILGHVETLWSALLSNDGHGIHRYSPSYQRIRVATRDEDVIDFDYQLHPLNSAIAHSSCHPRPLWVLFHGLEGSSLSHYSRAFAYYASQNHVDFCVPHFRGCSGQANLAPRAYHSGDWQEIDWMLQTVQEHHPSQPIYAIGVSLGGNALAKWAAMVSDRASDTVKAICTICAPFDLSAAALQLDAGLNRLLYTQHFMATLIPSALEKLNRYPKLFDAAALRKCQTFSAFDNLFTAPLHGFANAQEYWRLASAKPALKKITLPALLINAVNDPFIPAKSLPTESEVGVKTQLWQPKYGGHVGFVQNVSLISRGNLQQLPTRIHSFFEAIKHG
jgi:predicted alpha/beta-fold hydrolase